jgi:hypothetical protein
LSVEKDCGAQYVQGTRRTEVRIERAATKIFVVCESVSEFAKSQKRKKENENVSSRSRTDCEEAQTLTRRNPLIREASRSCARAVAALCILILLCSILLYEEIDFSIAGRQSANEINLDYEVEP